MDKDTVFGTDDGTMTGKPVLNDKQSHIYWQNKCQEQGKEIETLKVENNNLLVMVSNQQAEIESLRSDLKLARAEAAVWKASSDSAVKSGDEWERRCIRMYTVLVGGVKEFGGEIAKWFEEKDDE